MELYRINMKNVNAITWDLKQLKLRFMGQCAADNLQNKEGNPSMK
jgi:hypothetical protein